MRTSVLKKSLAAVCLTAVVAAFAGVASADDISNNLDASVDAVAEIMPLNVDGANGTTTLYVVAQNGDGKNGCNLTGSTTLVVSISSSDTSVATVSPSSVTFTSCGFTQVLTVTPHDEGSATISAAQISNNTAGTFDLAPVTFTVNVTPPTNTAPSVQVTGVTGGASYDKGSVPTATCEVTDAEDGNSSFAATLSAVTGPYAADGIGDQTASCEYTDGGGLTASASVTYSITDPTAPDISYVLTPANPDGDNDWYTSNVTLVWTVSEPDSPSSLATTGCVDQNITTDQASTAYSCSATSAGGSAGPVTVNIERDATKPTVSLVDGPADAASYLLGSVPAAPTCSASDTTSGLDGACSVSGYDATVGTHTVTANAKDVAGNSNSVSHTYTVVSPAPEVVGVNSVSISGTHVDVDSFNGSTYGSGGTVAGNGTVTVSGAQVNGSVVDPSGAVVLQKGASVSGGASTGSVTPNPADTCSPFSAAAQVAAAQDSHDKYSYDPNKGDLTVSGGNKLHLAGGPYCFHNVTISGGSQLIVSDPDHPVTITMSGQFNGSGGSLVNYTGLPWNLRINSSYAGNNGVTLSGGTNAYALVFAPNTSVTLSGGSPLTGAVLGKTLVMSGDSKVHCDTRADTLAVWSTHFA